MSGILGIVHLDESPVEASLVNRLMQAIAYRGSDGESLWHSSYVVFGLTFLQTKKDTVVPTLPLSIDDHFWIVADARIDARNELIAKLLERKHHVSPDLSDEQLILHAYQEWGEKSVDHLIGDFAFAIWDSQRRKLFCARDHLGVKPFYYARLGGTFIFSNTLDCVRAHPQVSTKLNDHAICDFLLFGVNQQLDQTCFADIQRLPPSHTLTCSKQKTELRRYWSLPIETPIYFKQTGDYTDHLNELLESSVADRSRGTDLGIFLSGGLDSSVLAVMAKQVLQKQNKSSSVRAITSVYKTLIPHDDDDRATRVAAYLNIPIEFDLRDKEISINDWNNVDVRTPEPVANPMGVAASVSFYKRIGKLAPVFFYGEGPDDALQFEWRAYLSFLVGEHQFGRLLHDCVSHALVHRRIYFVSSLPAMFKSRVTQSRWSKDFPKWISESFVSRLNLRERWREPSPTHNLHPVRPKAYEALNSPLWQALFEDCDINGAAGNLEVRHPFVDLRLLRYLLRLPAVPWCRNKHILREAKRDALPSELIRGRKTSLLENPDFVRVKHHGFPKITPVEQLFEYVTPAQVSDKPATSSEFRSSLRAIGLNYWLQRL